MGPSTTSPRLAFEREITARFGSRIPFRVDRYCPQTAARLRRIRTEAVEATTQVAAVCALHGMRPEAGWSEQFPPFLASSDGVGAPAVDQRGALYRLKSNVPRGLVRLTRQSLPAALFDPVIPLWSSRMHDWSRTRCFSRPCDRGSFLPIDLRGRERNGIVEPGAEYDELCTRLAEGFLSFRDVECGQPVVDSVDRADEQVGSDAPAGRWLPDLVIRLGPLRAIDLTGVRSDQHGEIR